MNRRRSLLIIAAAIIPAALVLAGFLVYLNRVTASKVRHFKKSAGEDWTLISDQARNVNKSLAGVASTADFAKVAVAAGTMVRELEGIGRSLEKDTAPPGYRELSDDQKEAVIALKAYLEKVGELAGEDDAGDFQKERGILESRSRKASAAVNEFLSKAAYIQVNIPNDFYQASAALDRGWQAPLRASSAEAQAVYDTANAFMSADIKENNLDKVWSMVSSTRKAALSQLKLTGELVRIGWRKLWGDRTPVDYTLYVDTIDFPAADKATIKAVVYFKDGSPSVETMRLVKENGIWKIETYPFVGWN